MTRTFLFAFILALLSPLPAAAQTSLAREAAAEMLQVYRLERGAGMLRVEERCWSEAIASNKNPSSRALGCGRLLLAGGIIDMAMQISEARGPVVDFTPGVQRQRFFYRTAAMGLTPEAAQATLQLAMKDIPAIVEGLSMAGLR